MTTEYLQSVLSKNYFDEAEHRVFIKPDKSGILDTAKDCYFDEDGDLIIEVE